MCCSPKRKWAPERVLRAAGVVDNQHDVDAVDFQQVDEKTSITLRIQPHGSHMFSSQGRIGAPRHLRQGLEDSVVLLHEEQNEEVFLIRCTVSIHLLRVQQQLPLLTELAILLSVCIVESKQRLEALSMCLYILIVNVDIIQLLLFLKDLLCCTGHVRQLSLKSGDVRNIDVEERAELRNRDAHPRNGYISKAAATVYPIADHTDRGRRENEDAFPEQCKLPQHHDLLSKEADELGHAASRVCNLHLWMHAAVHYGPKSTGRAGCDQTVPSRRQHCLFILVESFQWRVLTWTLQLVPDLIFQEVHVTV